VWNPNKFLTLKMFFVFAFCVPVSFLLPGAPVDAAQGGQATSPDPWTAAQLVEPADLVKELSPKNQATPTILYVGFRTLFEGGHIPGASFHGTASTEAGLSDLKKWVASLPRTTNLIVYCGCCPFDRCPNIRPASRHGLHTSAATGAAEKLCSRLG
jgi:rhodanese-related sulfurtransferase